MVSWKYFLKLILKEISRNKFFSMYGVVIILRDVLICVVKRVD